MDPQQRLALEATWEALENAGIPPQSLARSNTAVFMGVNSEDYGKIILEDLPGIEAWMGIGTAYCGVPNRVSYQLDFRGPSTAVDAACASSLIAIHHARQAFLARESDVAIAGGMNASIQYVEAHATSTLVGDPIEIRALSNIYGASRPKDAPCYAGSIKPNIGHLEAGAGVMGFIKAVLAKANLKTLNKKIDWDKAGIHVPFDSVKWPEVKGGQPRGAVCSYGYGGSVSHAIIEKAPEPKTIPLNEEAEAGPKVLLLSAPQEKRLPAMAEALAEFIEGKGSKEPLSTIACTLATRRGHHDCRTAVVATDHADAASQLRSIAEGKASASIANGRVLGADLKQGSVWMVSGHGAQWPEMGKELLETEAAFRDTINELEPIVQSEMGFSATDALATGDFESSDKIQALTFCMQVAIAAPLRSKGTQPSAVIGHSMGEIAAAVVAGALTPVEGALVICKRAVLYRQVMGKGAMLLVNAPYEEVAQSLEGSSNI